MKSNNQLKLPNTFVQIVKTPKTITRKSKVIYHLILETDIDEDRGVNKLRGLLKIALRTFGFTCSSAQEITQDTK